MFQLYERKRRDDYYELEQFSRWLDLYEGIVGRYDTKDEALDVAWNLHQRKKSWALWHVGEPDESGVRISTPIANTFT